MTKFLHVPATSTAGRMNAVSECGRLVNRLSLTTLEHATCPKCAAAALAKCPVKSGASK